MLYLSRRNLLPSYVRYSTDVSSSDEVSNLTHVSSSEYPFDMTMFLATQMFIFTAVDSYSTDVSCANDELT